MSEGEIFVLPAFEPGHLFPCIELCKLIASLNHKAILVVFSTLASSIPSSFHDHPLTDVALVPGAPPRHIGDPLQLPECKARLQGFLEDLLSTRHEKGTRTVCAIVDALVVIGWAAEVFQKHDVPMIELLTFGGCSAAMEYAAWKAQPLDIKPGEIRLLPGLPEEMGLTISDLKRRARIPRLYKPRSGAYGSSSDTGDASSSQPSSDLSGPSPLGPPGPGEKPRWVDDMEGSVAVMINTCHDLEGPFLDYLADKIGKPVWGVGPLLPDLYWKSFGSIIGDGQIRAHKQSNVTEESVLEWLDTKPRGSVLYVSFGTSVGLTVEEFDTLAKALEESSWSFLWVIQPGSGGTEEGYYPHGLDAKVGDRGLLVRGWAPQLLILSHPSTGGFLSHCGWNSTVEASGRGVPILGWPIRGDQFYDAMLLVRHHKVGHMISDDLGMVKKEEIVERIEKFMRDEEVRVRAANLRSVFQNGFPASALANLEVFRDFINQKSFSLD